MQISSRTAFSGVYPPKRPPMSHRQGTAAMQFGEKPTRKQVPTNPKKVQAYLEQLRAFPSASRVLFVKVFELQLSDEVRHIGEAMRAGQDDPHMQKLNAVILDALKARQKGSDAEQAEAHENLASLGEAQLAFLREIGHADLAERYIAFKARKP